MKTFKQFSSGPEPREEPLRRYSVYRHHLNGLSHYDSYDNPHEAHMTAQFISVRHGCRTHIMDNNLGHSIGEYTNGKPSRLNEDYLEEGKPKSINVNEVHTNKSLDRLLISLGWTALPRSGGHQKYFHPDHPEHLSVPVHSGDLNRMTTKQIIKKATGT